MNRNAIRLSSVALVTSAVAAVPTAFQSASADAPVVGGADVGTHATSTSWHELASPPVKPRSAVPWSNVGKGWATLTVTHAGRTTLMLYSPQGQGYTIADVAKTELVTDIRPDARAVVLSDSSRTSSRDRVVDLTTGHAYPRIPGTTAAKFSRPSSSALVVTVMNSDGNSAIQRRDYAGKIYASAPATGTTGSPIISDDGQTWVVESGDHATAFSRASMKRVRNFAIPAGYAGCAPTQTWDAHSFVETCTGRSGTQVFTQSFSGGTPQQRTHGAVKPLAALFEQAWAYDGAVLGGENATPMGASYPVLFSGGKALRLAQPTAVNGLGLTHVVDHRLYFEQPREEIEPIAPISVDQSTGEVVRYAGPGTSVGGAVWSFAVAGSR